MEEYPSIAGVLPDVPFVENGSQEPSLDLETLSPDQKKALEANREQIIRKVEDAFGVPAHFA